MSWADFNRELAAGKDPLAAFSQVGRTDTKDGSSTTEAKRTGLSVELRGRPYRFQILRRPLDDQQAINSPQPLSKQDLVVLGPTLPLADAIRPMCVLPPRPEDNYT
eukprot:comp6053_c0_seq1/m.1891 comp6053_c0_seq1/g.1891  ORF comp6053_c0_seq1/g.1891 comp6053_c0_seq1/m.1891 type:complete len:106 (-) comp6053_c0_seq1:724-1041(-)